MISDLYPEGKLLSPSVVINIVGFVISSKFLDTIYKSEISSLLPVMPFLIKITLPL